MTIIRVKSGALLVHSPIRLKDNDYASIGSKIDADEILPKAWPQELQDEVECFEFGGTRRLISFSTCNKKSAEPKNFSIN